MDILSAILGPVVQAVLVPVKKHLGYLLSSTEHVRNMSTRMKQLDGKSDDVKKHLDANNISDLEIPTRVPDWLQEVEKMKEDAERITSSNVNGCFNLKMKYLAGRKAFKTTQQIEDLIIENNEMIWSDAQKPLGKVSSKKASTSAPSDGDAHNYFKSRDKIFKEALSFLQQDHKAQVIALCGMGGVGKTTMMEQLKKVVEGKKMFNYVVKVVIGQKMDTSSIQQTMAEYLGISITEKNITSADRLRVAFEKISQKGEMVLVLLDDVWDQVELKDIGLSPWLKGVKVDVMEESEANDFSFQISEVSNPELRDIGAKIVRKCGFLPLAIKLIATNLKSQTKSVWRDTLHRLNKNDLHKNLQSIIEMSFTFIEEEDAKAVFLLCGLFPDDFNIPIEDLTRYAWGLKLLHEVPTLGIARDRTKTCVLNLKNANLLMDSDYSECVKMHDLVLAFVVAKVSKGDHAWLINHNDVSNWSTAEMSESCRRISLTCMGMSEFPGDFNYPNVSLLRLTNGDKSLKFAEDFSDKMENLEVMACEKLQYPLLPRSLQCSTKLHTLCLHQCSLIHDCSPIGDHLLNLEVLSFAHSHIQYLPSAIGNLRKLKLLDLTGCIELRIDEGVLKNLVKLEELYMTVANRGGIKFTDINYKELEERSKNLFALEVEFFEKNSESKNMFYNKLERFKISIGCFLEEKKGIDMHSSENTLMFEVATKDKLLASGINELFLKTEVLHLATGGMINLEEFLPKSVPSFYNLRVLCVYRCADLRYLFTPRVASGLVKLEGLTIRECSIMEALVYSENRKEGGDIMFHELKHLSLINLPMLVGLSNTNSIVIHLPQLVELVLDCLPNFTSIYPEYKLATSVMSSTSSGIQPFFNKQIMIPPRLEKLKINGMEALKNIWPCGNSDKADATCLLREIVVRSCKNLVNMFPSNPMPLLHHLESIYVYDCGSIEVLFDIDVEYRDNLEKVLSKSIPRHSSYNLTIDVSSCADLRYLFTVPVASGLVKLERLTIQWCPVMEALVYDENGKEGVIRFEELKYLSLDALPIFIGFSNTKAVIDLPQLVKLDLSCLPNFTSIYPAEYQHVTSSGGSAIKPFFNKQVMIPKLAKLVIYDMQTLKNVWPCDSSEEVDVRSLREIIVVYCHSLVNMFPRNPMPLLHHLETIFVRSCGNIKVLFDIDVGCLGKIKEDDSRLRSISVDLSRNLTEVLEVERRNQP